MSPLRGGGDTLASVSSQSSPQSTPTSPAAQSGAVVAVPLPEPGPAPLEHGGDAMGRFYPM